MNSKINKFYQANSETVSHEVYLCDIVDQDFFEKADFFLNKLRIQAWANYLRGYEIFKSDVLNVSVKNLNSR